MSATLKDFRVGTVALLPEDDFKKKLESGRKLKIKLGMDPTAPDLHLGHAVVLRKLKQFQDAGHDIIFLIGDFTARIGDPTGKSKTRPVLGDEEIDRNTKTYFDQVIRILDPNKVTIVYNSQWLGHLSFTDMVRLCSKVTLARIIEREDFKNRLEQQTSIGFHELLYPLMQGYDSVELRADVELGGTDQTFNLLMGRVLQEQYGQEPQAIVTVPLLEGLDGVEKMSKSLGNYVGLSEEPEAAFGKLMSISDQLMWRYFEVLLLTPADTIDRYKQEVAQHKTHPMDLKKKMACDIIATFWSKDDAVKAQQHFESVFQHKDLSKAQELFLDDVSQEPLWIVDLLKQVGALSSSSEARRLIESGAVQVDDQTIKDFKAVITVKSGMTLKVGKHRIYKLVTN